MLLLYLIVCLGGASLGDFIESDRVEIIRK